MNRLLRVITLAHNTWLELLRQRSLNILLLFGLAIVGAAQFFARFSFEQQLKFIKDISLGAMTLIGTIMALVSVAMALPAEMESRTLFTVLSKPVRRWEFLAGKFFGVAAMLTCSVALMSLAFGGVLLLKENSLILELQQGASARAPAISLAESSPLAEEIAAIQRETRDPHLVQALLLVVVKLWLTAAMALLVSTVATSVLFTVAVTAMLLIIGHLQATAREYWLGSGHSTGEVVRWLLAGVALLLPDLSGFTLTDEIIAGTSVSWSQIGGVTLYGLSCTAILVMAACACFHAREL